MPLTPNEQKLVAATEALVTVIEKIAATAVVDFSNPLNLLNFSADLALAAQIKTAVTDAKTVAADIKAVI